MWRTIFDNSLCNYIFNFQIGKDNDFTLHSVQIEDLNSGLKLKHNDHAKFKSFFANIVAQSLGETTSRDGLPTKFKLKDAQ